MSNNVKYKKFLECMQSFNCNINELSKGQTGKALPEKLLKNICGGELGFSRIMEIPEFSRQDFYRLAHH